MPGTAVQGRQWLNSKRHFGVRTPNRSAWEPQLSGQLGSRAFRAVGRWWWWCQRGTRPAGPPLTFTAAGKGLRGSRPHAAPLRMRARAALQSPESPRAPGSPPDQTMCRFTLRGPERRPGQSRTQPGQVSYLPGLPSSLSKRILPTRTQAGHFRRPGPAPGRPGPPPPHLERKVVRSIGIVGNVVRGEVRLRPQ